MNHNFKNWFCLFIILFLKQTLIAQINLPSVDTQALFALGKNDVSLYSGGNNVNVPLFTIRSFVDVPIALNYIGGHGIKVREHSSRVGLGWSLKATHVITKVVKGKHDADDHGFNSFGLNKGDHGYINWTSEEDNDVWHEDYAVGDFEPDLHYYSTLNSSGRFYCDKGDNFITIPLSKVDIEGAFDMRSADFVITETDGTQYFYSETELTQNVISHYLYHEDDKYLSSSCYLTKIVSANTKDSILFNYSNSYEKVYNYENSGEPMIIHHASKARDYLKSFSSTSTKVLDSINWSGGCIYFEHNTTRNDLFGGMFLEKMIVKNHVGEIVKNIKLEYSYFGKSKVLSLQEGQQIDAENEDKGSELRLKLDRVDFWDNKLKDKYSYSFDYNVNTFLPKRSSYSIDHWGYYNGESNNTLCPIVNLNPDGGIKSLKTGKRNSNSNYAQAGVLKKIYYPTGGYSEFVYGSNTVNKASLTENFRKLFETTCIETSSTSVFVHADSIDSEDYLYGDRCTTLRCMDIKLDRTTGTGILEMRPNCYPNTSGTIHLQLIDSITHESSIYGLSYISDDYIYRFRIKPGTYEVIARSHAENLTSRWDVNFSWESVVIDEEGSDPNFIVGGLRLEKIINSDGAGSTLIKKYNYNINGLSTGKMVQEPEYIYAKYNGLPENQYVNLFYANNPIYPLVLTQGSPVGYRKVTEYIEGNGKTESFYSSSYEFPDFSKSEFKTPQKYSSTFLEGYGKVPYFPLAEKQSNEMARGLLLHQIVYSENSSSEYTKVSELVNEYECYNMDLPKLKITEDGDHYNNECPCKSVLLQDFIMENITLIAGDKVFQNYAKFIKGQKFNSSGSSLYGVDYCINSGLILKSGTINTSYFNGNPVKEESLYEYNNFAQLIKERTIIDNEKRETFYNYPNEEYFSNLFDLNRIDQPYKVEQKRNGMLISGSEIVYKSFNSLIQPSKIKFAEISPTGSFVYIEDKQFDRYDSCGNLQQYHDKRGIVSTYLWGYNGTRLIAVIENADYDQVEIALGGECMVKDLRNSSNENVITEKLSELKNKLPKSLIRWVTYKPMIGLSKSVDPNGLTTYYEYDDFGRLKYVKDQEKNIIKYVEYNYKKQ